MPAATSNNKYAVSQSLLIVIDATKPLIPPTAKRQHARRASKPPRATIRSRHCV